MAAAVNEAEYFDVQTIELFGKESRNMAAAPLDWRSPSAHDRDRTEMPEPSARSIDKALDFVPPIGIGRVLGIVLHKLMEQFLTRELDDSDPSWVEAREGSIE